MLNFEQQIIVVYMKTDHRRALQTCTMLGKATQNRRITEKNKTKHTPTPPPRKKPTKKRKKPLPIGKPISTLVPSYA